MKILKYRFRLHCIWNFWGYVSFYSQMQAFTPKKISSAMKRVKISKKRRKNESEPIK